MDKPKGGNIESLRARLANRAKEPQAPEPAAAPAPAPDPTLEERKHEIQALYDRLSNRGQEAPAPEPEEDRAYYFDEALYGPEYEAEMYGHFASGTKDM